MSDTNPIPSAEKNLELPLQESSPINIPSKVTIHLDESSPCVPNTPPPTPEGSAVCSAPDLSSESNTTSNNSIKIPTYLNRNFFETALRTKYPKLEVTHFDIVPAVGVGENYVSLVFRANVATNQGPFALILKCIPETEFRVKMVNDMGLSVREMSFYNRILPLFGEYLEKDDKHPAKFTTPDCFYCIKEDEIDTIVLQDMKPFGFRTADRQSGLDKLHCEAALRELAKFHAGSIKLRIDNPKLFKKEIVDKYPEPMYSEINRVTFSKFMETQFKQIAQGVRNYFPYRFHGIANIIERLSQHIFNKVKELVDIDPTTVDEKVLVLNHGDFWSNNMLFQYESAAPNANPIKCCMLDFQILRCADPVLDLHYFLCSSTTKNMRDQYINHLLQFYLDTVYDTLEHLNVFKPLPKNTFYTSVKEIKEALNREAMFGFATASMIMPIVVANVEDAPDMDSFTEEMMAQEEKIVEYSLKLYGNPIFQRRYQEILEDFDNIGFFVKQNNILNSLVENEINHVNN